MSDTTIRFFIPGDPQSKGRPRIVRRGNSPYPVAVTPAKTERAERTFLAQALPYRPDEPLACSLAVFLEFRFGLPKACLRANGEPNAEGVRRLAGNPVPGPKDVDNLAKLVLDSLNGVFWRDDVQIGRLTLVKRYVTGTPGVQVGITALCAAESSTC